MAKPKLEPIHPDTFIHYRKDIQKEIDRLQWQINQWETQARRHPMPPNVRPMTARDVKVGKVVWRFGDRGVYWNIVDEVLHPDDDFKAYCADDGCRYGLHHAFIEIKRAMTAKERDTLDAARKENNESRTESRRFMREADREEAEEEFNDPVNGPETNENPG